MRKRIAFQIIFLVVVFMVIMFIVNSVMLARNSMQVFTTAKNELLGRDLRTMEDNIGEEMFDEDLLEYYEEHLALMNQGPVWADEAFMSQYEAFLQRRDAMYEEDLEVSFQDFADDEKYLFARHRYFLVDGNFKYYRESLECVAMAVVDMRTGKAVVFSVDGYDVVYSYEGDIISAKDWQAGSALVERVVAAETKQNNTFRHYLEEESDEALFGFVNGTGDGSWYVGYLPLTEMGAEHFALCMINDAQQFSQTLRRQSLLRLGFSVVPLLVFVGLLIWFLYVQTVKPVTQIQKSVRAYTDEKDTAQVVRELQTVKTENEFGMLSRDIIHLAEEMERYTNENVRLAAEHQRIATELELAARIQRNALPDVSTIFGDREDFEIAASMKPAKEVGGDFYDFFLLDEDHLALVIADVSGKGIPAALFMMMAKMQLENYAKMGLSPGQVMAKTNDALCLNNQENMFVTVWFGILELSTGKITASNAGHEYPVIRQPGGPYELIKDKHGCILGMLEGMQYPEYELTLQKGGMLFVYTDGVPEATRADNELFGTRRMVETLNVANDASPRNLLDAVHDAVDDFVGDAPQFDDLTMLAIKLKVK